MDVTAALDPFQIMILVSSIFHTLIEKFYKNRIKALHSKVFAKQSWNEESVTSGIDLFVIIVNSLKFMTIVIKSSILNIAVFITSFCLFFSILLQSHLRIV